jgi:hypothetical protein
LCSCPSVDDVGLVAILARLERAGRHGQQRQARDGQGLFRAYEGRAAGTSGKEASGHAFAIFYAIASCHAFAIFYAIEFSHAEAFGGNAAISYDLRLLGPHGIAKVFGRCLVFMLLD